MFKQRTVVRPIVVCFTVIGVMVAIAGCGSKSTPSNGSNAPDKVQVQLAWLMNAQSANVAVGVKEGIYTKYGLDVTLNAGGPNVDPIQNVVSGSYQFGIANSNGTLVLARGQGLPIKAIGATYQKHPYAFFYKPNRGINKPQDLRGKTIGIQSTGRYLLTGFLSKIGLKESDVKIVTVGSDLGPLASDQADAVSAWMVNAGQLSAVPDAKYFLTFDYGLSYYAGVFFTTDKMIKEKPDVVKRFMKATMEAHQFAIENAEKATADVVASAPNMDKAIEGKTLELSIPLWSSADTKSKGLGYMDKKVWEDGQQMLIESAQMQKAIDVTTVFTNEFITDNTPKR